MELDEMLMRGATYSGSWFHSVLNYALIAATVLPHLLPRRADGLGSQAWMWPLLISALLQIAFWLWLGADGVSVVWCTMAGFTAMVLTKSGAARSRSLRWAMSLSLVASGAAIVFYAISFPVITTVAHVAAVVLGMGIWAATQFARTTLRST